MNDREYAAQKKRVMALIRKWRSILGLNGDRIHFTWHRTPCPESPSTVMWVKANWQYRNHYMDIYLTEVLELPDDELEETVVHEFVHLLIHPATGDSDGKSPAEVEKMEFATTSVAYAIIWAYQAGKNEAKRKPAPRIGIVS
mgnify:CR=1 FL=1